jgi:hypothetical protein
MYNPKPPKHCVLTLYDTRRGERERERGKYRGSERLYTRYRG